MSQPILGEIKMFAGNFAPRGWAFCQGQLLSIAQNTALFSLLGTTYGGNGQTTFALPNMQSRTILHPGQGPGLPNFTQGEMGGQETVTLTISQVPPHTHNLQAVNAAGNSNDPATRMPARPAPAGGYYKPAPVTVASVMNAASVGPNPGGQPHSNLQPFLGMNFIIALEGIFPSRN